MWKLLKIGVARKSALLQAPKAHQTILFAALHSYATPVSAHATSLTTNMYRNITYYYCTYTSGKATSMFGAGTFMISYIMLAMSLLVSSFSPL
jgi:hypothetical protein